MKKIVYLLSFSVFLPAVAFAQAQADVDALYKLVWQWFYSFLMPLAAILTGIVILIAGIMYISSGGDASKTGKAKELIFGALTGFVTLICASLIIRFIIS